MLLLSSILNEEMWTVSLHEHNYDLCCTYLNIIYAQKLLAIEILQLLCIEFRVVLLILDIPINSKLLS